jgi:hypothetical protein
MRHICFYKPSRRRANGSDRPSADFRVGSNRRNRVIFQEPLASLSVTLSLGGCQSRTQNRPVSRRAPRLIPFGARCVSALPPGAEGPPSRPRQFVRRRMSFRRSSSARRYAAVLDALRSRLARMAETFADLPPLRRVAKYRELAHDARRQAGRCQGATRDALLLLAYQWEMLAVPAESSRAGSSPRGNT